MEGSGGVANVRSQFVAWAQRVVVFFGVATVALLIGVFLLSSLPTPIMIVIVISVLLGAICLVMMFFTYVRWMFARSAHYRHLPSNERSGAHLAELRSRGAPDWWIRSGRAARTGYVLAVTVFMTGIVLVRPDSGGWAFALKALTFGGAIIVLVFVSMRLRRK